ncbi:hypothetical protein [uncultured Stenotrophomonas sp.]|uniref:hypothetical protein n=1 Tax=uncultured Stenotrophomonas sp. TaxID=165438 RepID=UPI0028D8B73C|nr:hypothetical protein [uncultured Stenotrophomonas sp.]
MAAVLGSERAAEKVEIRTLLKRISIKTIKNWQAARQWQPTWRNGGTGMTPDLRATPQPRCVPQPIDIRVANSSWLHQGWGAPGREHPGRSCFSSPGAPAP